MPHIRGQKKAASSAVVLASIGMCLVLRPLPVRATIAGFCRRMSRTVRSAISWTRAAGVVERGQQGRVTPALAGGAVRQGEQPSGLLDGQVRDRRLVVFA